MTRGIRTHPRPLERMRRYRRGTARPRSLSAVSGPPYRPASIAGPFAPPAAFGDRDILGQRRRRILDDGHVVPAFLRGRRRPADRAIDEASVHQKYVLDAFDCSGLRMTTSLAERRRGAAQSRRNAGPRTLPSTFTTSSRSPSTADVRHMPARLRPDRPGPTSDAELATSPVTLIDVRASLERDRTELTSPRSTSQVAATIAGWMGVDWNAAHPNAGCRSARRDSIGTSGAATAHTSEHGGQSQRIAAESIPSCRGCRVARAAARVLPCGRRRRRARDPALPPARRHPGPCTGARDRTLPAQDTRPRESGADAVADWRRRAGRFTERCVLSRCRGRTMDS